MKKIKYVFPIILIILAVVSLTDTIEKDNKKMLDKNIIDNNSNLSEKEVEKISEENIIYSVSNYSLLYEPTVKNLYDNAYIVVVATFDKDIKTYSDNGIIRTDTQFNTKKVIKNNSNFDVSKNVTIKRNGGIMNLQTYMNSAGARDILKGADINQKNTDISSLFISEKTPYTLKKDNVEYLLFIDIYKGELYPCELHHGIKEINNNKVYDYDSKTFIDSNLVLK